MTTYDDITHLYAVTRQRGTGTWAAESSQFGLRFGLCFGDELPALDAGIVTLDTHSVDTDGGTETFTNYDVDWGFSESTGSTMLSRAHQLAVANAVLSILSETAAARPSGYQFEDLRLYPVLQDGTIPSGLYPTIIRRKTGVFDGSSANTLLDPANAVVASLYSANRTKQGRGRVYIGPWTTSAMSDGRIGGGTTALVGDRVRDALDTVRAIGDAAGEAAAYPIVWRRTTLQAAVVNSVKVNNVWDNQSRRTKSVAAMWETYALA